MKIWLASLSTVLASPPIFTLLVYTSAIRIQVSSIFAVVVVFKEIETSLFWVDWKYNSNHFL